MKFSRVWFFGGDKRDNTINDYVTKYIGENNVEIECQYSFTNFNSRWYVVEGKSFDTLKEAKEYAETIRN